MSYTVLARRYRSQTFDDVVGQNPVAQTLKNAIDSGRVAHAYLFSGTRGVGKTTMARILAKALNCLNADGPTTKPCCKCDSCTAINIGEDIDVIEIDGASNNSVDNIRELRQNAIYRPARARHKIYIIDEVHMLTTSAFNALLKILEEPPGHVKFIFATTEPNKVLPTIQSRCQRFDFSAISPTDISEQIKAILKKEKVKADDDLVLHVSRLANGSMRDALSLLDQLISAGAQPLTIELLEEFLGEPNRQKINSLIESIAAADPAKSLTLIDELLRTGLTCTQISDSLIDHMRDIMVLKSTDPMSDLLILTADERKQMTALAENFDLPALIYNITALEKLRWTIKNSDTPRALMEAAILRFTLSEHFLGIEQLVANISNTPTQGAKKKPLNNVVASPVITGKANQSPSTTAEPTEQSKQNQQVHAIVSGDLDLEIISQKYNAVLDTVRQAKPQIASLLSGTRPSAFNFGNLTISFANDFTRGMCEKKQTEIEQVFSSALGQTIKLKFVLTDPNSPDTADDKTTATPPPPGAKISKAKRDQIESDPAIMLIKNKLNAHVTDIEEVYETESLEDVTEPVGDLEE